MSKPNDNPTNITKTCWYYESKRGIDVMYEIRDREGQRMRTDCIHIPWVQLVRSLKRCQPKVQR